MHSFEVSQSLHSYFKEGRIRSAVDSLMLDLGGKKMPQCSWSESQDFNLALLLACQVRTDFVDLLYRVWDDTFGRSGAERLKGEWFDSTITPHYVWEERYLQRNFYRSGRPEEDGLNDTLGVWIDKDAIFLYVARHEGEARRSIASVAGLEGWKIDHDDTGDYLKNEGVSLLAFLDEPGRVVERFEKDASLMIDFLLSN